MLKQTHAVVCTAALMAGSGLFAQMRIPVPAPDKTVLGSPYLAEGTNESVQTLADGTRITRTNTVRLFRDSQGRTRLETRFEQIGAWSTGKAAKDSVMINDPASGQLWQLDPESKTAILIKKVNVPGGPRGLTESHAPFKGTNDQVEDLGRKTILGVNVEGTRLTHVIQPGEEGNDKAITVQNERWYSPDLQTVVLSTHNDPRLGLARYQLTSISRAEPDANLFQVPSDYIKRGLEPAH